MVCGSRYIGVKIMSDLSVVSDSNFEQEVGLSSIPTFVKAFTTWCQPCKRQSPILEKIAANYSEYKVVQIDCDDNTEFSQKYNIQSLPTTILFIDGKEVSRFIGLGTEKQILALIPEV